MNNAHLHYAQASQQAAAIRDAYRNPPRPQIDVPPAEPPAERRSRLAEALGRVAQAIHRREDLLAVR